MAEAKQVHGYWWRRRRKQAGRARDYRLAHIHVMELLSAPYWQVPPTDPRSSHSAEPVMTCLRAICPCPCVVSDVALISAYRIVTALRRLAEGCALWGVLEVHAVHTCL